MLKYAIAASLLVVSSYSVADELTRVMCAGYEDSYEKLTTHRKRDLIYNVMIAERELSETKTLRDEAKVPYDVLSKKRHQYVMDKCDGEANLTAKMACGEKVKDDYPPELADVNGVYGKYRTTRLNYMLAERKLKSANDAYENWDVYTESQQEVIDYYQKNCIK